MQVHAQQSRHLGSNVCGQYRHPRHPSHPHSRLKLVRRYCYQIILQQVPGNQTRSQHHHRISPRHRNDGRPSADRFIETRPSSPNVNRNDKAVNGVGNTTWNTTQGPLMVPLVGNVKVTSAWFNYESTITTTTKHYPLALHGLTAIVGFYENRNKVENVSRDYKEHTCIKNSVGLHITEGIHIHSSPLIR